MNDVEVVTATVDLQEVRAHRTSSARSLQAAQSDSYERIRIETRLSTDNLGDLMELEPTVAGEFKYHTPEEEIS